MSPSGLFIIMVVQLLIVSSGHAETHRQCVNRILSEKLKKDPCNDNQYATFVGDTKNACAPLAADELLAITPNDPSTNDFDEIETKMNLRVIAVAGDIKELIDKARRKCGIEVFNLGGGQTIVIRPAAQ